jgi:hypothetical protein
MHKVLILDPAVGTGTFMHRVIEHIYEGFKNQKGMWSGYVSQHLLPCSYKDYMQACRNEVPERWWNAVHKMV